MKASEALKRVEVTLDAIDANGHYDRPLNVDDPPEAALKWLSYIRAFLMWHADMESYEGTFVALCGNEPDEDGFTDIERDAFRELPGNLGMGVMAVLSAGDTLESVMEELPRRLKDARMLLDRPPTHGRTAFSRSD